MKNNIIISKIKAFKQEMSQKESRDQFVRYLITGFTGFAIEYLLFRLFLDVVGLWYILANSIVLTIVFWFNFMVNRIWSFKSKSSLKRQVFIYFFLFIFNIGATNGIMYLAKISVDMSPAFSKILAMGAVVSWNFVIYKKIIYK